MGDTEGYTKRKQPPHRGELGHRRRHGNVALSRGDSGMKRIEQMVLNTFLSDYPDTNYKEILALIGTDKVEAVDWFRHCEPDELREAMYYLYVDTNNLLVKEILDYDNQIFRSE
jgi:hypothetical protein